MSFIVATRDHGLLPVARRLRASGQPVYLLVADGHYRGTVDGGLAGGCEPENLEWAVSEVEAGAALVTDLPELWVPFGNGRERRFGRLPVEHAPQSSLRLGGWFDGSHLQNPHVLVCDIGPWNEGGGDPGVLGGLTLIQPDPGRADLNLIDRLWERMLADLKARDFRGLVQAGIGTDELGSPELQGLEAGWPVLHTEAWLSELENLDGVLAGGEAPRIDSWTARYTTALPLSIAPWPGGQPGSGEPLDLQGLTPQQTSRVLWHDVAIDRQRQAVVAARRDGLLGIARGSAHTLELSRARAMELALGVQVPGKQVRTDVGRTVPQVLAALEAGYGLLF